MVDSPDLANRALGDVIEAIGSEDVAPGAGSAGAVGLALAAACAAKAAAVTLKHRDHDEELAKLHADLTDIARRALRGAEDDASQFAAFIRERDARSAEDLLQVSAGLSRAARALRSALDDLIDRVDPSVRSDVTAAQALCDAFSEIHTTNLVQNRAAAAKLSAAPTSTPKGE